MSEDQLFAGAIRFLVLLLSISLHESAHALTALRAGDETAAKLGRISLNPLRHLDLIGSVLVPMLLIVSNVPLFGWARPTPVQVSQLRRPEVDHLRIALAGPLVNLVAGLVSLGLLSAVVGVLGADGARTAGLCLLGDIEGASEGSHFPVLFTIVQFAFLNLFLAFFNMIPVPPLDGGQIALQLLPSPWAGKYSAIRPYGFMIVLALAALNVVSLIVLPVYFVIAVVIQISG